MFQFADTSGHARRSVIKCGQLFPLAQVLQEFNDVLHRLSPHHEAVLHWTLMLAQQILFRAHD